MTVTLFLSHSHHDKEIAQVLARTLVRITLNQLNVWFSSDTSPAGGIPPGRLWFDEIRSQLERSKAVLTLLTPNTLPRMGWLLFESGLAAAVPDREVIPVCLGISATDGVPFPLAMYQSYQLSDYESLKVFASKVITACGLLFDEELAQPVLRSAIKNMTQAFALAQDVRNPDGEISLQQLGDEIKSHIDRRFFELGERRDDLKAESVTLAEGTPPTYSVPILVDSGGGNNTQYVEITHATTVQDVLDKVYGMLDSRIEPYTYLESWMLRETNSRRNLVIREVQDAVPARYLFVPGSRWEAIILAKPYSGIDSADYLSRRRT